jgi:ribosomal protein S3
MNFKGERKEIIGLKIKLKGRIDRWKRTKTWIADTGSIIFQSYNSYLDYGYTKGIVKKGTFSIRVWMQYKPIFINNFKTIIFKYYKYSKIKQKYKFQK